MNRPVIVFFFCLIVFPGKIVAQATDSISRERVEKIITYLASDELKGRVNHTTEQLQAAEFIGKEFSSYGLEPFPGFPEFYQAFRTSSSKFTASADVKWNDKKIDEDSYYFFSNSLIIPSLNMNDLFIYKVYPPLADSVLYQNWNRTDNILLQVMIDDSSSLSEAISNIKIPAGKPNSNILIVGRKDELSSLQISPNKKFSNSVLYNVIGMIPGRGLPEEVIIFSAHYDHVDRGLNGESGEIYNGANDDASGTTAVIELANYFSKRKDNERTLLFCLFAGEEMGLLGSKAFVNFIKPENVKAVINIEMIGVTNIEGKNGLMVTGSGYSNLYKILKQNLQGDEVKMIPQRNDPNNFFERSDNFSFALEGIPAHTLTSSDDDEPCYHRPCDDVDRIDMDNMTRFIKAIARSASTLISGKDTPTRIKGF